jgi:amino acid permease
MYIVLSGSTLESLRISKLSTYHFATNLRNQPVQPTSSHIKTQKPNMRFAILLLNAALYTSLGAAATCAGIGAVCAVSIVFIYRKE